MQDIAAGTPGAPAAAFLDGALRQEAGLTSAHLDVGLAAAAAMVSRGALVEALQVYLGLVLCEPKRVDTQVGLSHCALLMEQYELALRCAAAVIMLAPRDPRGFLLSARACIGMGHLVEAQEDLDDAISHAERGGNRQIAAEARGLRERLAAMRPPLQ